MMPVIHVKIATIKNNIDVKLKNVINYRVIIRNAKKFDIKE